jgi:hypothetical protein
MAKANSKNIGNNYERQFSYKLSEWITGQQGADICWRDLGSGNRKTTREKKGLDTARKADIVCTESVYEWFFKLWYIDTKSYKEFNWCMINPKNKKSNDILQQWIKTVDECPQEMIPFMPTKIRDGRTPDFILIPKYVYLSEYLDYIYIEMRNKYSCYLILQDSFFNSEKAEEFYKKNKHYSEKIFNN